MKPITRRTFVSTSGRGIASLAAGGQLFGAHVSARAQSEPASRTVWLALVGAGGRGSELARNFAAIPNVRFKYVCEADAKRGAEMARNLETPGAPPPRQLKDFREALEDRELDGVVVATPEHWHALATIWACQAGKHVYVEKNPSLRIWEGRKMIEAARKYNRVVQVGFQNRSAPYATTARAYIASGKLGKVVLVKVYNLLPGGPWQPVPDAETPAGLDWDLWLGPAQQVPFNPGRLRGWGDFWDYQGGTLAGDGSHQLDLTRNVLGDPGHPLAVNSVGGHYAFAHQRQTPDLHVISFEFPEFVLTCENGGFTPYMKKFPREVRYGTQWPDWPRSSCRVEIYGTQQLMYLGRHGCGWQVFDSDGKVVAEDKGYFPDKWHQPNFIDCIRSGTRPNADIEQAHFSACLVHLANASLRTGNPHLKFDGASETFKDSDKANALLRPAYREGFAVPDRV
jgi:predicted dehydrogenase